MFVYYSQILFLLLAGVLFGGTNKNSKRMMAFCLFFLMFFVMAFRDISVGVDTETYSDMFKDACRYPLNQLMEMGTYKEEFLFFVLMKFCSLFSDSYYFFQFVFSFLFCLFSVRYLKNSSTDLFFCGVLFVTCGLYLCSFNIQRQMLSIVLLMNGWNSWVKERRLNGLVFFLIAELIHLTSFVFLLVVLLYEVAKRWPKFVKIAPAFIIALLLMWEGLMAFFADNVVLYSNYLGNHKTTQTAGGVVLVWGIISLLSIFVLYFKRHKDNRDFFIPRIAAVMSLFYVATNFIGLEFNYFERIGLYFMPFIIVVYESFCNMIYNKGGSLFIKLMIGAFYIYYYILSFGTEQYHYKLFI